MSVDEDNKKYLKKIREFLSRYKLSQASLSYLNAQGEVEFYVGGSALTGVLLDIGINSPLNIYISGYGYELTNSNNIMLSLVEDSVEKIWRLKGNINGPKEFEEALFNDLLYWQNYNFEQCYAKVKLVGDKLNLLTYRLGSECKIFLKNRQAKLVNPIGLDSLKIPFLSSDVYFDSSLELKILSAFSDFCKEGLLSQDLENKRIMIDKIDFYKKILIKKFGNSQRLFDDLSVVRDIVRGDAVVLISFLRFMFSLKSSIFKKYLLILNHRFVVMMFLSEGNFYHLEKLLKEDFSLSLLKEYNEFLEFHGVVRGEVAQSSLATQWDKIGRSFYGQNNLFNLLCDSRDSLKERLSKFKIVKKYVKKYGMAFVGELEGAAERFESVEDYLSGIAKLTQRSLDEPLTEPLDIKEFPMITELLTRRELIQEGKVMGHCVGGYGHSVKSGCEKIFSIIDNDGRSTAQIYFTPEGVSLRQHKGVNNTEPYPTHISLVESLILKLQEKYNISSPPSLDIEWDGGEF